MDLRHFGKRVVAVFEFVKAIRVGGRGRGGHRKNPEERCWLYCWLKALPSKAKNRGFVFSAIKLRASAPKSNQKKLVEMGFRHASGFNDVQYTRQA